MCEEMRDNCRKISQNFSPAIVTSLSLERSCGKLGIGRIQNAQVTGRVDKRQVQPINAATVVRVRLLASFGRVFAQFFQKPQQCQPFGF